MFLSWSRSVTKDPCSIDPDPSFRPVCREFHVLYSLAHAVPTLYLRAWRSGSYNWFSILLIVGTALSELHMWNCGCIKLVSAKAVTSLLLQLPYFLVCMWQTFFKRRKLCRGWRIMEWFDDCRMAPFIWRIWKTSLANATGIFSTNKVTFFN